MTENTKISKQQQRILALIKEKGEVSQPEITDCLIKEGEYNKTGNRSPAQIKAVARVSVCQILKKLEAKGLVRVVRTEQNKDVGGIDKNFWGLGEK